MATMNISLPDMLRAWVDEKVDSGSFSTASDYVRDLVRRDRDYQTKLAALQVEIQKGLDSGVSKRTIPDIIAELQAESATKHAARG